MKILIIANAKAGRGKIKKYINSLKTNLQKLSYEVEIKFTTLENDATSIIKNYNENYDKLIICGGDGTLNQATEGLCELNKKVSIGYIPIGTTNDFARSLGVSKNKLDISKNIDNYEIKQIDTGRFNNRFFNYVASIGVFSKTSYKTSTKLKNIFGRLAYLFFGIQELFNYKIYDLKIFTEDSIIEDKFIYGSISNSKYVGGFGIFKNENIEMDDGKFEAVFVKKPKNIFHTIKLALKVLNGNLKDDNVYYFKTSSLKIVSEKDTEWSIDGEYSGKVKNIEISNLKQKMNYLIPKF